eukprot:9494381-Pyramimonas_sp.AAC.1
MGRPPPPDDVNHDGPEEEFREAVAAGATRWMPDLSDAESGGRSWRGWCVPYVMECLRLPQHSAWVAAVIADDNFNSLRELAYDICNDAW